MATRQYIGARYIPVFADPVEWNSDNSYEYLTMVQHQGETYMSKQEVPIGIDLPDVEHGDEDNDYWVHMSNWNAQVESYRQEVLQYNNRISTLENDLPIADFDSTNTVKAAIDDLQKQIGTGFDYTDNITAVIGSGFDATDSVASAINTIEANDWVTTNRIADSNVTTSKIADDNVTTAKIADENITTAKIADANVTTAKIADANVTTGKLANNAVTFEKLKSEFHNKFCDFVTPIAYGCMTYSDVTNCKSHVGAITQIGNKQVVISSKGDVSNGGYWRNMSISANTNGSDTILSRTLYHSNSITYDVKNNRVLIAPVYDTSSGTELMDAKKLLVYDTNGDYVSTITGLAENVMGVAYDHVTEIVYVYCYDGTIRILHDDNSLETVLTIGHDNTLDLKFNQDFAIYNGYWFVSSPQAAIKYGSLESATPLGYYILNNYASDYFYYTELEGMDFNEDGVLLAMGSTYINGNEPAVVMSIPTFLEKNNGLMHYEMQKISFRAHDFRIDTSMTALRQYNYHDDILMLHCMERIKEPKLRIEVVGNSFACDYFTIPAFVYSVLLAFTTLTSYQETRFPPCTKIQCSALNLAFPVISNGYEYAGTYHIFTENVTLTSTNGNVNWFPSGSNGKILQMPTTVTNTGNIKTLSWGTVLASGKIYWFGYDAANILPY